MRVIDLSIVVLNLYALPVFADVLNLAQTQDIAVLQQPLLRGQEATVAAERARAIAAAQLPDPQLKLGVNNVPTDTYSLTQDFMTMRTIGIAQTFPGGHKRRLRGAVANLESERAAAELDAMRRGVRRDAALAWLDVYYALHAHALIAEQQHEIARQIDAARINYRTGKGNQEEIFRVGGMLNQLLDRESELVGNERRARAALARWIGAEAERELAPDLPATSPPPVLEVLNARLVSHPEIYALDDAVAAADAAARLARAARTPDWMVELSYSQRGPAFSDMVSAQLSVDLPLFPGQRQNRRIAERAALRDDAQFQRDDKLRNLRATLAALYADEGSAAERLKITEERMIPTAQDRVASVLIAYRDNKVGIANVYEAHHAALEARLQQLTQRVALTRARVQLAYFE